MARQPAVTRTIKTTKAIVKCVLLDSNSVEDLMFSVPRTYNTEKELMKAIDIVNENENIKPVAIVSTEVVEQLYAMSEADFIKYANPVERR